MTRHRSDLLDWAEAGHIAPADLRRALELAQVLPDRARWRTFLDHLLLWLGTVLLGAGAVFFLAYNWQDLGRYAKFGLAEALIIAALGVYVWQGPERIGGRAALLAAAIFTGALLALIGQTYQTGADTFELFATWAVAILPWALLGRFPALWIFWLAIVNLAALLYFRAFGTVFGALFGPERQLWVLFGLNTLALAVWSALAHAGFAWLHERWALRLLATASAVLVTLLAVIGIVDTPGFGWGAPAWLAWSGIGYAVYRRRAKDVYMLACGVLSAVIVAVALLARLLQDVASSAGFLLLIGLVVLGLSAAGGYWLKRVANEETAA